MSDPSAGNGLANGHGVTNSAAAIVATCLRMLEGGLVVGTSGNVSVRDGDTVLITPSGVDYRTLRPQDVPTVDLDGKPLQGTMKPTSELPLHLAVYAARPDVTAIVHTHALHATAVSTLVDTVPNIHYALAASGTPIEVADYATYGSDALARNAIAALGDAGSCLLRNHGTVSVAADLDTAYAYAEVLEWACKLWLTARSAGTPTLIPDDEIAAVAKKLQTYGQGKGLS
jgi:L-fuculose-phosphate aldolase